MVAKTASSSLVSTFRPPSVEDREADTQQWCACIALEIFAIGIADQEIDRFGEQKRPHVPEISVRIDMAIGAEGRCREERFHFLFPVLAAVRGEDVSRLRAELEQEAG
jgi:hypothetical protein